MQDKAFKGPESYTGVQLCKESLLHTGCTQPNGLGSVHRLVSDLMPFYSKKKHGGFSACYKYNVYGRDPATNYSYYYLK